MFHSLVALRSGESSPSVIPTEGSPPVILSKRGRAARTEGSLKIKIILVIPTERSEWRDLV